MLRSLQRQALAARLLVLTALGMTINIVPRGTVNGGGPQLYLRTSGGSVYVKAL